MKKTLVIFCAVFALAFCVSAAVAAPADEFDYLQFASHNILKALHPTANVEDAIPEYVQMPTRSGETVTAQVRVFYKGWIRKHELVTDIKIMETSAGDMISAAVLKDTNPVDLTKNWVPSYMKGAWTILSDIK